jgi:hypothetical protein
MSNGNKHTKLTLQIHVCVIHHVCMYDYMIINFC